MRYILAISTFLVSTTFAPAYSDDWPMWRHDAGRTGATPENLPDDLSIRWTWQLGPTTPAWPASQTKLQFDRCYEPACAKGRLVIGSPVDGRVMAVDLASGNRLWTYFTEGPVRFAPAIANGRVYITSDDGRLHCVSLADGTKHWSVNGGPSRRRIIGNDRLVSMWPARGGVAVQDGVAYFSAGIWPSMGIFIRAVDAESGKVLWTNSTTGSRYITHPHGADSFGSISPQGYLAISGDTLLVPGGRTLPGGFDLKTGKLRHFEFGGKGTGGYEVMAIGDWYCIAGNVFRAADGASAGRLAARVVSPEGIIGNEGSNVVVTKMAEKIEEKVTTDRRGNKRVEVAAKQERIAQFSLDGPSRVYLQAGERIFAADGGRIAAYELAGSASSRKPVWSAEIDGEVASMLAADGCLIVTTLEGHVLCFGDSDAPSLAPHEFRLHETGKPLASAAAPHSPAARNLIEQLKKTDHAKQGYAVYIRRDGVPSLAVLHHLLNGTELSVVVIVQDAQAARQFRAQLADRVADPEVDRRVSVLIGFRHDTQLPPYLASLVICSGASREYTRSESQELQRILRPYGGTCLIWSDLGKQPTFPGTEDGEVVEGISISRGDGHTLLRRNGPLPDSGQWTHQYGDATNSVVSADARVKPPFGLLWFGGPSNDRVLPRHGHGPSPQVAGGRLFIEGVDMLRCVDVYNGRVWWERELPGLGDYYNNTAHHPGAGEIGSNYVSLADNVYVVHGDQLLELDAETGETTRDFELDGTPKTTWGALLVEGDVLFATANPVTVAGSEEKPKVALPKNSTPLIPENAEWRYLAGSDPEAPWSTPQFDVSDWKTGRAGFGYGDGDDRTVLRDMPGKYQRVYIRREFDLEGTADVGSLALVINYDDAFIAYLNGHEVHRVNVRSGAGPTAKSISSHEASGAEVIPLKDASKWLKSGRNVLAIEGHNTSRNSSDFSLDPYLLSVSKSGTPQPDPVKPRLSLAQLLEPTKYSSGSRLLVAFNRRTGEQLWSRPATFNYRHNAICAADGRLFCIDMLSSSKLAALKRRGVESDGQARLLALDAETGEEVWSTGDDVFGTFLNYSREQDVLLQGGSAYRDRAKDETKQGLIAYRGETGEVVWKDRSLGYGGPCLLRHDRIITNGGGGFELDLLTGKRTGWTYSRMYGCNTAIGSEHLLTFRSGAAGFCDLANDSGTGNLGGFRSSCTSNLIVADGVLNAPDYTRTCSCAYQLQTSLAMIHDPDAELWTFGNTNRPVKSLGLNFAAPGDRREDGTDGLLWFEYPAVGGPSPKLDVRVEPQNVTQFARHSALMNRGDGNWIGASGLRGVRRIHWKVRDDIETRETAVRLVFSEPDGLSPGERVFSVRVNGREILVDFDIAAVAPAEDRTIVREAVVPFDGTLQVELIPKAGSAKPVISGIGIHDR